jgi:hypothetical protein
MLAGARYFGSLDLQNARSADETYFDLIGNWFVHYPASWNFGFLILTNVLLVLCLIVGFAGKQVRPAGLLTGIFAFPLTLVILYFLSDWTLRAIRAAAPLYLGYYSNTYHPYYYFLSLAALAIAVFTFLYRWLLSRFSMPSIFAGTAIVLVAALDGLYRIMPTAIYFLCFPLLTLLAGGLFSFFRRMRSPGSAATPRRLSTSPVTALVLLIPTILFLAPIGFLFFLVFDLQPQGAIVPAVIAIPLGCAIPLLSAAFRESRWWIPGGALALSIVSLTLGLFHRGHSSDEPAKTSLDYVLDADSSKAHWVSLMPAADAWNKQFFPNAKRVPPETIYAGGFYGLPEILVNDAPLINASPIHLTIGSDSIIGGHRILSLHGQAPGANSVILRFTQGVAADIIVDGRGPAGNPEHTHHDTRLGYLWLEYKGIAAEGFDLTLQLDPRNKIGLSALTRFVGLPHEPGFAGFPLGVIPGPENLNNATLVVKRFTF